MKKQWLLIWTFLASVSCKPSIERPAARLMDFKSVDFEPICTENNEQAIAISNMLADLSIHDAETAFDNDRISIVIAAPVTRNCVRPSAKVNSVELLKSDSFWRLAPYSIKNRPSYDGTLNSCRWLQAAANKLKSGKGSTVVLNVSSRCLIDTRNSGRAEEKYQLIARLVVGSG